MGGLRKRLAYPIVFLYSLCLLSLRRFSSPPFLLSRHPLSLQSLHSRSLHSDRLRYLTLGSSSTWGAGLEHFHSAFPYLLGDNVHNAATRVGGPVLSALCTESIVGDLQIYDVIVLEFSHHSSGLLLLAQRVRQRFPSATLLFVQLWSPSKFYFEEDSTKTSLDAWRMSFEESLNIASDQFASLTKEHEWFYEEDLEHEIIVQHTVEQVNGQLYRLPRLLAPSQALQEISQLFQQLNEDDEQNKDSIQYTLSPHAHAMVAKGIQEIVFRQPILKLSNRNTLGTWGSGDSCHLWYETANVQPKTGLRMRQFSKTHNKYALEVPQGGNGGGSFTIDNPFGQDRMVYLTYMTTSASSNSNKVYPRTKISLSGKPSVLVDPYHESRHLTHLTRTSAIGFVAPGTTSIHFESIEQTLLQFRVVGVSFFATEKNKHKIATEYAFGPDPAPAGPLYKLLDLW
jgi:hypothetical protein